MLVSVVVPAYNEVGYIDKLLRSLRAQTVPCEIVVCDNNSTDGTARVAKRYADKVVHEPRRGIAHSFNAACRAASGDLIAMTGADCLVPEDWIERFLPFFEDDRIIACYGPVHSTCRSYRRTFKFFSYFYKVIVKLKIAWGVSDANLIIRKSILDKVGYFDTEVQMMEDSMLMRKIRKYGKLKFLSDNIVKTSPRRLEKEGAKKVFIDRTVSLIKMKLLHRVGDEKFEAVR
ncbi:MAG: glycosyltransferase [Candidatus Aenigmarchaeota archaeon]|nr:glycosyltransferase [Candidatus Aenigmarchaeota archaeon]